MSISELMDMAKPAEPVRRMEVFTGAGRRRRWTLEKKARIVAESYVEGETVCSIARRHALTRQRLFTWRREARSGQEIGGGAPAMIVPAVVEAPMPGSPPSRKCGGAGLIEVEIGGVMVRVGRGAEPKTVAAVIRALKAAR